MQRRDYGNELDRQYQLHLRVQCHICHDHIDGLVHYYSNVSNGVTKVLHKAIDISL